MDHLNITAVGMVMAALTSAVFGALVSSGTYSELFGGSVSNGRYAAFAVPTLLETN